jgi:predicted Fe-Mo cluster-binding NifX family protein
VWHNKVVNKNYTKETKMHLMISSQGQTMESKGNPRFGRTPFFIKYNTEDETWKAFENPAQSHQGGAGVAAAQFLINQKAVVAISGRFGPNAHATLSAAGIKMVIFSDPDQTIQDLIKAYQQGLLEETG